MSDEEYEKYVAQIKFVSEMKKADRPTPQCGSVEWSPEVLRLAAALHSQIQFKLEAIKAYEDTKSKLTELESCLEWCSVNVKEVKNWTCNGSWSVYGIKGGFSFNAPTLIGALMAAWEGREK